MKMSLKSTVTRHISSTNQETISTKLYMNDVRKYNILSAEEEKILLNIIKNGTKEESEEAKETLINANLRFVISIAKHIPINVSIEDLICEGNIGLIESIENYKSSFGVRFLTYAYHNIKRRMMDYIYNLSSTVTRPCSHTYHYHVNKTKNEFFKKHHRYPQKEELIHELKKKNVVFTPKENFDGCKITYINDMIMNIDGVYEMVDETRNYTEATCENNIENDFIEPYDNNELLNVLLSTCNEKERNIIKMYFGIDGFERSIATIAEETGYSEVNIRVIIRQVINKLKDNGLKIKKIL